MLNHIAPELQKILSGRFGCWEDYYFEVKAVHFGATASGPSKANASSSGEAFADGATRRGMGRVDINSVINEFASAENGVVTFASSTGRELALERPEWGNGGASEWASLGDAVYLVVRMEQWDTAEVEAAHEAIISKGGKLRGYITFHGE